MALGFPLGFAHLSTLLLPSPDGGRSSPQYSSAPSLRQLCGAGSAGSLGTGRVLSTGPLWWNGCLRRLGTLPVCWPHGPVVPCRPKQRELVHHEEHGYGAGHHPHWLLHPGARHPGKNPKACPCGRTPQHRHPGLGTSAAQMLFHAQSAPGRPGSEVLPSSSQTCFSFLRQKPCAALVLSSFLGLARTHFCSLQAEPPPPP